MIGIIGHYYLHKRLAYEEVIHLIILNLSALDFARNATCYDSNTTYSHVRSILGASDSPSVRSICRCR